MKRMTTLTAWVKSLSSQLIRCVSVLYICCGIKLGPVVSVLKMVVENFYLSLFTHGAFCFCKVLVSSIQHHLFENNFAHL